MTKVMTLDPADLTTQALHGYLLGAVAPRPIAFASTVDEEGRVNLSPYSFFNCFSSNPPTLIFSPSRRVRDNSTKDTLANAKLTGEVVINIVNYPIVEQMSLSSTEYEYGVNEFIKAGFTEEASVKVKPPRVLESPAAFECVVKDIIELGTEGGAGNLIICEVVMAHIHREVLDEHDRIDPYKLDAVGRMGGDWYSRAQGDQLFRLPKPSRDLGMGMDQLPEHIRTSPVLSGNQLARLANLPEIPAKTNVEALIAPLEEKFSGEAYRFQLHALAGQLLDQHRIADAWTVLMRD